MAKRQRSSSPDGAPQTKKRYEEPPAEPVHGQRPMLKAELNWKTRNHITRCHGTFLLDTGCTGPILNQEFVKKEKIPIERRNSPIQMLDAQGDLMMGAGEFFTAPLEMVMGKHEESLRWEVGPLEEGISGYLPISWVQKHNPDINWHTNRIQFRSEHCKKHCIPTAVEVECIEDWEMLAEDRNEVYQVGTVVWHDEEGEDVSLRLLPEYKPWADVFSTEKSEQLPEHSSHDHHINLVPGTKPPFGPLYPCSDSELKVLKEFLNKAMASGKITRSNSSAAAPILFVPKANGKLRICVDYRGLNKITVKDKYPLPLMSELRDRLRTARVFTKLDLKDGFNLLRIAQGDEWKTAFRTRYGLYQYNVMPFGLCNAPSSFQAMINEVLHDLLDQGVIAYIDDILIYSENMRQHVDLVQQVLQRLRDAGLHASIDKSFFHLKEVEYLGYQISEHGISMSKGKVNAVQEWPVPRNVKDVQAFLGFANFYRRFIEGFSRVCKPLTDLLRKDGKWFWSAACDKAFQKLKELFTSEPVLSHFHPSRRTVVETDASDFAKGAVLSQYGEDGKLHPVAFYSKKHSPAEINYDIHDKEMGAIVAAFREWEHLLKSVEGEVTVFTDHKNLEYFNTTKVLTRRQARWSEDLAGYNFKVIYRPGVKNNKPDVLSRRWDHRLGEGGELEVPIPQTFFRPGQLVLNPARLAALRVHKLQSTFLQRLKDAGDKDEHWLGIRQALQEKKTGLDPALSLDDGLVFFKNRWYVPEGRDLRQEIFSENHDSRVSGHFGQYKTAEKIKANFYWPNMDQDIDEYVRSCDSCQRNKTARHKKYGELLPLEVPYRPWTSISMDFIVGLPESGGYTKVWVIVDRFSKMAHFIPLPTVNKTEDLAKLFLNSVWKHHGLPDDIVSDRDSKFISHFWQSLMDLLSVKLNLSTAFHPQTDGQTERVNQVLEGYMRSYCSYQQDDWADLLPLAEYAYNSAISEATKFSPFCANYGFEPRTNWPNPKPSPEWDNPASKVVVSQWESIWLSMSENLAKSRLRMTRWYNKTHQQGPEFSPGDEVMLDRRNVQTKRPMNKLDQKRFGPFKVKKAVGKRAYELELPQQMRIHPVFHVALLEPYKPPADVQRRVNPPEVEEIDGEVNWVLREIANSKVNRQKKRVEYLVLWEGFEQEDATWEPWGNLKKSAEEALLDFHKRYPKKPRDARVVGL
jgi:RNase H-like domain found in reverse transcriptase/Reverse transcriptase (RNA-dependent DNA polymerase)/Integrase zinc binding domain/Chromo (CHRromatin Organisation MOdifier) domain/Integrase core domain